LKINLSPFWFDGGDGNDILSGDDRVDRMFGELESANDAIYREVA
jgi:hypothetical protein